MMLPILISVSLAPVSYFFWASAPPVVAAKAMTAVENAAIRNGCFESMLSPSVSVSSQFADQMLGGVGQLPGAVRHQEDDDDQDHAEHRAGQPFGDVLCD